MREKRKSREYMYRAEKDQDWLKCFNQRVRLGAHLFGEREHER